MMVSVSISQKVSYNTKKFLRIPGKFLKILKDVMHIRTCAKLSNATKINKNTFRVGEIHVIKYSKELKFESTPLHA